MKTLVNVEQKIVAGECKCLNAQAQERSKAQHQITVVIITSVYLHMK